MVLSKKDIKNGVIAMVVLLSVVAFVVYWRTGTEETPGDYHVKTANYRLEDGQFEEAIKEFGLALAQNPKHPQAYLGLGVTHMQMGEYPAALEHFTTAIDLDPEFALAYADRGILNDRMGRYPEALADYKRALELDPKITEGPGWLWRFMHNVKEKPSTIADRAYYLETELKKPVEKRLLKVASIDEKQKMYKK